MDKEKDWFTISLDPDINRTLKPYCGEVKKSLKGQSEVIEEALIEYFEKRNYPLKKG